MTDFDKYILYPFLGNIAKSADWNAFCINGKFYTYREFGRAVSRIQQSVAEAGPNSRNVGLVINDDLETYASIFALWLEGESYVPLHPGWPPERCRDIAVQSGMDLILDSSERTRYDGNVLHTSSLPETGDQPRYLCEHASDDDLAYILFTSGSTGKPKGVQISRGNIGAFMRAFWQTGIKIDGDDRCLQCFDLTFDVSVQSFLVPLTMGACCYTIPHGQIKYIYASGLIEDHRLTFGAMAPSMIRFLRPYFDEIDMSSLRTCIFTAEASPLDLVKEWMKVAPEAEIYDFYGPTEATIYCTYYKLSKTSANKTLNGVVSIGKPMADVDAIIVGPDDNIVPQGEKGELCVAGPQVTSGYLNNPQKNAEAFMFKDINGRRLRFYRTGDLCFRDENGDIMYSGRLDHQAKIQGYRVEMGEIEFHAREFLGGTNVVCIAYENAGGLTEIAMFIESEESDTSALLDYLKSKMPHYMIPGRIYFEPTFPLNGNAKTDKVVLKSKIKI